MKDFASSIFLLLSCLPGCVGMARPVGPVGADSRDHEYDPRNLLADWSVGSSSLSGPDADGRLTLRIPHGRGDGSQSPALLVFGVPFEPGDNPLDACYSQRGGDVYANLDPPATFPIKGETVDGFSTYQFDDYAGDDSVGGGGGGGGGGTIWVFGLDFATLPQQGHLYQSVDDNNAEVQFCTFLGLRTGGEFVSYSELAVRLHVTASGSFSTGDVFTAEPKRTSVDASRSYSSGVIAGICVGGRLPSSSFSGSSPVNAATTAAPPSFVQGQDVSVCVCTNEFPHVTLEGFERLVFTQSDVSWTAVRGGTALSPTLVDEDCDDYLDEDSDGDGIIDALDPDSDNDSIQCCRVTSPLNMRFYQSLLDDRSQVSVSGAVSLTIQGSNFRLLEFQDTLMRDIHDKNKKGETALPGSIPPELRNVRWSKDTAGKEEKEQADFELTIELVKSAATAHSSMIAARLLGVLWMALY